MTGAELTHHEVPFQLSEDAIRHIAEYRMSAAMDRVPTMRLDTSERDRLIIACKSWVRDHPEPVRVTVELTAEDIRKLRAHAWAFPSSNAAGVRDKVLDALPEDA